jgi:hypothetical protein
MVVDESVHRLTLELLEWIAVQPRTYGEAMVAWRSTWPRHPVWDDAVRDGLIQRENGRPMNEAHVLLTHLGRAMLESQQESRGPSPRG